MTTNHYDEEIDEIAKETFMIIRNDCKTIREGGIRHESYNKIQRENG